MTRSSKRTKMQDTLMRKYCLLKKQTNSIFAACRFTSTQIFPSFHRFVVLLKNVLCKSLLHTVIMHLSIGVHWALSNDSRIKLLFTLLVWYSIGCYCIFEQFPYRLAAINLASFLCKNKRVTYGSKSNADGKLIIYYYFLKE